MLFYVDSMTQSITIESLFCKYFYIMSCHNIAAQIAYDGSKTSGWAQQKGLLTVEGLLQEAILQFSGQHIPSIACAGRTDKGVHATTQIISFYSGIERRAERWLTGLNHYLPPHIRVQAVKTRLPENFHARYSAQARCYRYYLYVGQGLPFLSELVTPYHHKAPDFELLQELSALLKGTHDFKAFQGGSCDAKTTIKTVHDAFWERQGALWVFQIRATSFLHHMVRFIVGCLLEVASGRQSIQWWRDLLSAQTAQHCCMPPQGLYLCDVSYEALDSWVSLRKPWFDLIP
jgi:tRNA pseudouridine38-40 synthase